MAKYPTDMCENLHKIINIMANPTAKPTLYKPANTIKIIKIKLPKPVSNRETKRLGTANITTHKKINKVINPTARLIFLRETSIKDCDIYLIIII